MNKKGFTHNCGMSGANVMGGGKTVKRKNEQIAGNDKESLKEIYNRYYRNQVAALYNAVREN